MPVELIYRFGTFELDLEARELRRGREPVPLQPRVFALAAYLAANPDRAISRSELLDSIWSDVRVEDGSLTRAIRTLRSVLRSDPSLVDAIATVRGFGYRFLPEVEILEARGKGAGRAQGAGPPLVSRESDLAELSSAMRAVREGDRRVVLIAGEAGTGKTALARHALELAAPEFVVGEGQCIEGFGAQSPYLPILEALVNFGRGDGFGRGDRAPRHVRVREVIERAAPEWKAYLPTIFPESEARSGPLDFHPSQMARQMLDAIELLADDAPSALLIEDVHWADQSTLRLIDSIAQRSARARLLVVCTLRTGEIETLEAVSRFRAGLLRSARAIELETGPVSIDGVRDYATWATRAARDDGRPQASSSGGATRRLERGGSPARPSIERFVDWLHRRTSGHPLFLTQLIDHLASLELLSTVSDETFSATQLDAAGIPRTLAQLLRQWGARLEPEDRAFLEAASVAGFHFDLRVVEAALGIPTARADEICDRLCAGGWLQFRDFSSWPDGTRGARLRFGHALFVDALSEAIPASRRARHHQAIALRLERGQPGQRALASELASHFERAGDRPKAERYRIAAATFATSSQASDEALHHAESGLRGLGFLPEAERAIAEADLLLAKGISLSNRHGFAYEQVEASFERARELSLGAGDAAREAAAIWGVSSCREMRGELEAARVGGERLLELARTSGDSRYHLLATDVLCNLAFFQARFGDCIALADAAARLGKADPGDGIPSRSIEDVQVACQAYAAVAYWHRGEPTRALQTIDAALARARELRRPYTEAVTEAFAAILHALLGNSDRQRAHAARGHRLSLEEGVGLWAEIARFMEICADPPEPRQLPELHAVLKAMSGYGGLGGTYFLGLLAERERIVGSLENARSLCAAGIEIAERTTERNHLPILYLTAAKVAEDESLRRGFLKQARESAASLEARAMARQVEGEAGCAVGE